MRAYRDTITLELDEIEQRVLANFYDMVSDGILEDFQDEDVVCLLHEISLRSCSYNNFDEDIPDVNILYTKGTQIEE